MLRKWKYTNFQEHIRISFDEPQLSLASDTLRFVMTLGIESFDESFSEEGKIEVIGYECIEWFSWEDRVPKAHRDRVRLALDPQTIVFCFFPYNVN